MPSTAVRKKLRSLRQQKMFLGAWVRSPLKVGALVPSSRFLARHMARQVDVHHPGWVIELGAGTGVVTKALLEGGVKPERLLVVERDRRLHKHLHRQFPDVRIVRADAKELQKLLQDEKIHKVNAIVSSLPLLSMPRELQDAIVGQMLGALPSEGILVQYTYGHRSPIRNRHLKHAHAEPRRAGMVMLNMPPATVWSYRKQ